jgi:hypothetical protein
MILVQGGQEANRHPRRAPLQKGQLRLMENVGQTPLPYHILAHDLARGLPLLARADLSHRLQFHPFLLSF